MFAWHGIGELQRPLAWFSCTVNPRERSDIASKECPVQHCYIVKKKKEDMKIKWPEAYLYPMKRVISVALETAQLTGEIGREAFPTPIACRSRPLDLASQTIQTLAGVDKISSSCPSDDFVEVRLPIRPFPYNMRVLLNQIMNESC